MDVSQTERQELPDHNAVRPKLLDSFAPKGIWDALVYPDSVGKKIAVRADLASAQAVKTLVHELGHSLLHGDEVLRSLA